MRTKRFVPAGTVTPEADLGALGARLLETGAGGAVGVADEADGRPVNVMEMTWPTSYRSIFAFASNCTLACVPPRNLPWITWPSFNCSVSAEAETHVIASPIHASPTNTSFPVFIFVS